MTISPNYITDDFATTAQITPDDITAIAAAGFHTIINNRPDFEGGETQPLSVDLERTAKDAGLSYAHLPIDPNNWGEQEAEKMRTLINSLPKPVLGFCRTGTRAGKLYLAAIATKN